MWAAIYKTVNLNFLISRVLDPPRNGCDRLAISGLLSLNCQNLLYISCNPLTLARDLELLSPIYKVNSVQPIDMFPQTDHVETIVQLLCDNISVINTLDLKR